MSRVSHTQLNGRELCPSLPSSLRPCKSQDDMCYENLSRGLLGYGNKNGEEKGRERERKGRRKGNVPILHLLETSVYLKVRVFIKGGCCRVKVEYIAI